MPERTLDPKDLVPLFFLIGFLNVSHSNLVIIFSVIFILDHRMRGNLNEISLSIAYVSLQYLINTVAVKNEICR